MSAAEASVTLNADGVAPSNRGRFLRELMRKKIACAGLVVILLFYGTGLLAPVLWPYDPNEQHISVDYRLQSPSWEHPLGTDRLGRDLLSRDMQAMRVTVLFTIVVVITGGLFLGLGLGLLAGYRGGWVDTAIMRVGEVLCGLPTLIFILAITAAFRTRINNFAFDFADHTWLSPESSRDFIKFTIIALATLPFSSVGTARIVRSQALSIRSSPYIEAAELMGASTWRIITRHVFPGVLPLFVVGISGSMGAIAGAEIGLSYVGLGIEPPTASFGSMIADAGGPKTFQTLPHLLLAPAVPVILFYYAWNLLGDALVDLVEPRHARR